MEHHAKQRANHPTVVYGLDGLESLNHVSFHVDDDVQNNVLSSTTTPTREWYAYNEVWDAPMVHGCVCDFPWTGFDCSTRECPRGDDPLTSGQRDAVQLVECNTTWRVQWLKLYSDTGENDAGSFALRYGAEYTRPMPHNATASTLRARLRALVGVGDDDSVDDLADDTYGKNSHRKGPSGGGVRVDVTDSGAGGAYVARAWNLTVADGSSQAPLVPLWKQPEVQVAECAADRGFFTLRFPAPYPRGSAFSGVCLGGPKAGINCITSDDCVDGTRTGEGSKCGAKLYEEVKLKFDATQAETAEALQSFSLIDRVHVNFSDISAGADNNGVGKGLGGGKFCTPKGNTITVTFLRTRLDVLQQGDLPALEAVAGSSLKRQSTSVANLEGSVVLTHTFRERVKGVDTCAREEVQVVACRASGGNFTIALNASLTSVGVSTTADDDAIDDGHSSSGSSGSNDAVATSASRSLDGGRVTLPWDATQAEVKAALESLALIENVTVIFTENLKTDGMSYHDGGRFCGPGDAAHTTTITFHALEPQFAHRLARLPGGSSGGDGGDVPPLTFSSGALTHDASVELPDASTEVVKGLACEPLGATYVIGLRDDDRVAGSLALNDQPPQMASGVVSPNQDGGYFALGFLDEATVPIPASASASEVEAALNALPTLRGAVQVGFSRMHACEAPANVMAVTFLGDFGVSQAAYRTGAYGRLNRASLPPLVVDRHAMPKTSGVGPNGTWATPKIAVHVNGASDSSGVYASQNATKENDVCSYHGRCEASTGVCDCFTQQDFGYDHAFASSDGRGGAGSRGDCGFMVAPKGDPRSEWQIGGRGGGATVRSAYSQSQQMVHEQSWGLNFAASDCPGLSHCSGHGHCSGPPAFRCTCAEGWQHAPDCSERECPRAPAWFDYPTSNNNAHDVRGGGVECSGRGACDRDSGECACQAGFTGGACQYTQCPGKVVMLGAGHRGTGGGSSGRNGVGLGGNGGALECSGHGQCLSMKQLAYRSATPRGDAAGFTYGEEPNNPFTWDADRVRGCSCDPFWTGADCSERTCPLGDDPNTHDDVAEVQLLNCTATGGTFTLSFRSEVDMGSGRRVPATTTPLPHNATASMVTKALEALSTIEEVVVTYSAQTEDGNGSFCVGGVEWEQGTSEANVVSVRFVREGGDLPPLVADGSHLVNAPYGDDGALDGGSGLLHVASGGASMHGVVSVAGSREAKECSGRGVCNRNTGVCDCFPGYASSDGGNTNSRGNRGDCGYLVGDRLLRSLRGSIAPDGPAGTGIAAGLEGRGASDPARAYGLEDKGREGGSSGNGGHQLGGSYPESMPNFEVEAALAKARANSRPGQNSGAAASAASSTYPAGQSTSSLGSRSDADELLGDAALDVLSHVSKVVSSSSSATGPRAGSSSSSGHPSSSRSTRNKNRLEMPGLASTVRDAGRKLLNALVRLSGDALDEAAV